MTNYEFALELAERAHFGQHDKAGKPYIDHVKRVASSMSNELLKTIAILHDTLEDTFLTKDMLLHLFSTTVVYNVDLLTRKEGESYSEYIDKILGSIPACKVKLADLEDNMNLSRLKEITDEDLDRVKKYEKARKKIKEKLDNVDTESSWHYDDVY